MLAGTNRRASLLILIPAALIALAVFGTASIERSSALQAATSQEQSQQLLTAMLDQETGARGYFVTGQKVFLQPWYSGSANFAAVLAQAYRTDGGDPGLRLQLSEQAQVAGQWHAAALAAIARFRRSGHPPSLAQALSRKALMDSFRAANAAFSRALGRKRDTALSRATWLSVLLAAVIALGLTLAGVLLLGRNTRREELRRHRENELRELMQASDSEEESRSLLVHHIERMLPRAGAAVLNRNHSDDRLEPSVSERVAETPLRELPAEPMHPRDCLAVRLSRPHERGKEENTLAQCRMCGKLAADVACEPLLVGGRVIGSVLVANHGTIPEGARSQLRNAVVLAAPIIAHQRNLGMAERRAASDSLTGLPNRRAADDTIKRMAAQAGRSATSLAAILMDLDHFKQINDVHGHDQGDETLAAVAAVLSSTLRASDFAARYGGEEFLILLPATTRDQARTVAEKLRSAVEEAEIGPTGVTASFGIAELPADAANPEQLLRRADQALYAAKAGGRNRVELAGDARDLDIAGLS